MQSKAITFDEILDASINTAVENSSDAWKGSIFYPLTLLTNDERGKWGESFPFRYYH